MGSYAQIINPNANPTPQLDTSNIQLALNQALGWKTLKQKAAEKVAADSKQKDLANLQEAIAMIKGTGETPEIEYDKGTFGVKGKAKKEINAETAMKNVLAGIGSPEEESFIGQRAGVSQPPAEVPGMTMEDGSVGNIPNPDGTNYSDAIRSALVPDYSKQDAVAELAGLPKLKKTTEKAQSLRDALKEVVAGTKEWKDLYTEFPDEAEKIDRVKIGMDIRKDQKDVEPAETSKYKEGETRVINGVPYKRDASGKWNATVSTK